MFRLRDLKGFLEVLFLKVLLEHTGVEVVVHLVVEPGSVPASMALSPRATGCRYADFWTVFSPGTSVLDITTTRGKSAPWSR